VNEFDEITATGHLALPESFVNVVDPPAFEMVEAIIQHFEIEF
jgi:hypothetical protein